MVRRLLVGELKVRTALHWSLHKSTRRRPGPQRRRISVEKSVDDLVRDTELGIGAAAKGGA
jgi:hypothetical protein